VVEPVGPVACLAHSLTDGGVKLGKVHELLLVDALEDSRDHPVRIDYERVVSVADICEGIDDDHEFEDFPEFHRVVGEQMRADGYWPYGLEQA
jgi:hypothetical protein